MGRGQGNIHPSSQPLGSSMGSQLQHFQLLFSTLGERRGEGRGLWHWALLQLRLLPQSPLGITPCDYRTFFS